MIAKLSISAHDRIGTVLEYINHIRPLDEDELALRSTQKFVTVFSKSHELRCQRALSFGCRHDQPPRIKVRHLAGYCKPATANCACGIPRARFRPFPEAVNDGRRCELEEDAPERRRA